MAELTSSSATLPRLAELSANLHKVRTRIADAAHAAKRDPRDITLVVVTKRFPASDVALLAQLGVTDVGENRLPEAAEKHAAVSADLRWHFIGQVQTNKAKAVAACVQQVDTVDRLRLVTAMARAAPVLDTPLDCLVQVNLDGPSTNSSARGGAHPDAAQAVAEAISASPSLRLRGVMGMAPLGGDPVAAFTMLGAVAAKIRAVEPAATEISAGMSGDLEAAIAAGATHVRIGTAILGERPDLR